MELLHRPVPIPTGNFYLKTYNSSLPRHGCYFRIDDDNTMGEEEELQFIYINQPSRGGKEIITNVTFNFVRFRLLEGNYNLDRAPRYSGPVFPPEVMSRYLWIKLCRIGAVETEARPDPRRV